MSADLVVHDRALREVVDSSAGRLFKHTGDGGMATFSDPQAAVRAAVEIQRVLASIEWEVPGGVQVRVAVSTGTVIERDGDVFGSAVNRAARLLALCPPNAVLVTDTTAALIADRPLRELELVPVGEVVLRGFTRAELVHAVRGSQLALVARIGSDADGASALGSLPSADEHLVGRQADLHAVSGAVLAHPIVTIVGVGGMGKTRLALEVAWQVADEFPGGAAWCDLSVATSADAVAPVVMDALDIRQAVGHTALESVLQRLIARRVLVVLDNCEHVLEPVRVLLRGLRESCATVGVLATSREALGVPGEYVVGLSSLPVDEAIELFVERALAARPDLDLTSDTVDAVREMCTRLDGIPLAVELAAARCRSMTPAEINDRLRDRFRLLRGGRATTERHRTLQAAVAWSYDYLEPDERRLFDHFALFADGSLVDGIAAVAELDEYDALDLIDRLVARSMVTPVSTALGTRYRQPETLRLFAEDRLAEQGVLGAARDRHLAWVRDLAVWIHDTLGTSSSGTGFRRYVAELDNIRLAVGYTVLTQNFEIAKEIVAHLGTPITLRPDL